MAKEKRTNRVNILPPAELNVLVFERVVDAGHAVKPKTVDAVIEAFLAVIKEAALSKKTKTGEYFDIPGICRIMVKSRAGRVVRIPLTGAYKAVGDCRQLKIKPVKEMRLALDAAFAGRPSEKVKMAAAEKNGEEVEVEETEVEEVVAAPVVPKKKKHKVA